MHNSFYSNFELMWAFFCFDMPHRFCLIKKFSLLRRKLCKWNFSTYRNIESKIKMVKSRFKVIENKSEVESLTNVEANELRYLNFEL